MNEILLKNLAAMQNRYAALYDTLRTLLAEPGYSLFHDSRGFVNVSLSAPGQPNRPLYELSPTQEFVRSREQSAIHFPRVLIIQGVGLGYHVTQLLAEATEPLTFALMVEPDPKLFLAALSVTDFSSWLANPAIHFLVGVAPNALYDSLKQWLIQSGELITMTERIGYFSFVPLLSTQATYFQQLGDHLKGVLQELNSRFLTLPEDHYVGFSNLLGNAERFKKIPEFTQAGQPFLNLPGVVVSSGPSLALHLEALKKYQDRVVIACVDSAVALLLKAGIKPDILFTLERLAETKIFFENLPRDWCVPMVCLPVAYPEALAVYPGPLFVLPTTSTFASLGWPEAEPLSIGSCVSTMGMVGLHKMGCTEIALLGQDLAYDRQSQSSHVQDMFDWLEEAEKYVATKGLGAQLVGNDGQPIPSNIYWESFKNDFANLIPQYGINCLNVIPAAQGAHIPNAKRLDPDFYWTSVSTKKQIDKRWTIAGLPLQLGGAPLQQKIAALLPELKAFSNGCLDLLDEITFSYHENLVFTSGADRKNSILSLFKNWRKLEDKLLETNQTFYQFLVDGFLRTPTIVNRRARNALWPTQNSDLIPFAAHYVKLTQTMVCEWQIWAQRLIRKIDRSFAV